MPLRVHTCKLGDVDLPDFVLVFEEHQATAEHIVTVDDDEGAPVDMAFRYIKEIQLEDEDH